MSARQMLGTATVESRASNVRLNIVNMNADLGGASQPEETDPEPDIPDGTPDDKDDNEVIETPVDGENNDGNDTPETPDFGDGNGSSSDELLFDGIMTLEEPMLTAILPETVTHDGDFVYDDRYDYTVVITYTRSYTAPDDDDDDDIPTGGGTIVIPDPIVPLGPLPENVITILDTEVPLGALPSTGSASAKTALGGSLMMMLGAIMNILGKKKKSDEDNQQ